MTNVPEIGAPGITVNLDYTAGSFGTNAVITAAGQLIGMIGSVWHPTVKTGTINIRKVHFRCGAITANYGAGTQHRVSLQNVSSTAGPPYQPDGSQDQFYDFKTATTTLTQNAWNTTGALSADRAVDLSADSLGDTNSRWLAVVWEYQAFSASDSLIVSTYTYAGVVYGTGGLGGNPLLNTASWALVSQRMNNVLLECDDGTFAFLMPSAVFSALNFISVGNAAAVRRAGVRFKVPTQRTIDRASLAIACPNGADGSIVLYDSDGTTILASVDVDNDAVAAVNANTHVHVAFQPVTLLANTYYRLAFVSTSATTATVPTFDVNAVAHMDGMYLGQNASYTAHDGANWAETTTRNAFFGLGFSGFDVPSSGLVQTINSEALVG